MGLMRQFSAVWLVSVYSIFVRLNSVQYICIAPPGSLGGGGG